MKRRIICMMIAMLLVLGMPMQALAATHDVEDFAGVQNAFTNDTDAEVTVNLKQDITWESQVTAGEGQTYTVNGNGNTVSGTVDVAGSGDVTVKADVGGVKASNDANITIDGDVNGNILATNSTVTVAGNGNDTDIWAEDSTVTVKGSLIMDASDDRIGGSIGAVNSDVTVSGSVTGMEILAQEGSNVIVGGNADIGMWIEAENSTLNIGGNAGSMMGISAKDSSTVNVGGNINTNILATNSTVTVAGNGNDTDIWAENSTVTVKGSLIMDASDDGIGGSIGAVNSDVTVSGSVTGMEIWAQEGSNVIVGGNADIGMRITADNSTLDIGGNADSMMGISASNGSTINVDGSVTSDDYGIMAESSSVTVGGNVSGGTMDWGNGSMAMGGIWALDSNITVEGNVSAGNAGSAPGTCDAAITVLGSSEVTVYGNVTGGNASGEEGIGGDAICIREIYGVDQEIPFTGSVKIAGTVTAGKGEAGNGLVGDYEILILPQSPVASAPVVTPVEKVEEPVAISIIGTAGSENAEVTLTITVSEDAKEVVIEEMKDEEIETLLETLKETIKENDEGTVTIDVSVLKEATSVKIPVKALKAIIEAFGKLEIVFNGGTIIIDAEMLEELIDELGFFIISLK